MVKTNSMADRRKKTIHGLEVAIPDRNTAANSRAIAPTMTKGREMLCTEVARPPS
jgi:hypothetical protein